MHTHGQNLTRSDGAELASAHLKRDVTLCELQGANKRLGGILEDVDLDGPPGTPTKGYRRSSVIRLANMMRHDN